MTSHSSPIIIVGSGTAGYAVLRQLRQAEPQREIVLVTADEGWAYSWDAFSTVLAERRSHQQWALARAEQIAHRYVARVLPRTRVTAVDRANRQLIINADDHGMVYSQLILATGGLPVRPKAVQGTAAAQIMTISSLAEYAYFFSVAAGRARYVIVGGGLEGCQLADGLCKAGMSVLLCEAQRQLLPQRLPGLTADFVLSALTASGVHVRLEDGVQRMEQELDGVAVHTLSGHTVLADGVIAALGSRPNVELARKAGLDVEHGIVIDAQLRTSAADIFALGRCAFWPVDPGWQMEEVEQGAQALAAVVAGHSASLRWRPRLRYLQFGSQPLVLCEPPREIGEWQEKATRHGVEAQFVDHHGQLRGFALAGQAASYAEEWLSRVVVT